MINRLTISNFKSIKSLDFECRRINLFIGEPNTGKSNILEALGFISSFNENESGKLKDYIRYENTHNLFYDSITDEPIRITYEGKEKNKLIMSLVDSQFAVNINNEKTPIATFNDKDLISYTRKSISDILYYKYKSNIDISQGASSVLATPHGGNLFMTAYSSRENREIIASLFKPYGLKPVFKPQEKIIEIQKQIDDVAISYPYSMTSDTLLRIIFYMLAIKSNTGASLVFEEPEAHAFPYYTKHLGEVIAADTSNQYFIATHNPYLLNAVIEHGKVEDVNICAVYYEDYQTKIKQLSTDQIALLLEQDPFLALDHFTGK